MLVKFIWEDWFFILRYVFIIGALLIGQLIQKTFLYPDIAFFIRDSATVLFRALQFDVIRVNSSKGIGVQFNDYAYATPEEVEVLHALLSAGCISFSFFLALTTDFSFHNLKKVIKERKVNIKTGFMIILKAILLLLLFLPYTFFRFIIIIMIFLLLWDTAFWSAHYAIAHDLIGNLILSFGTVLVYCYLMYKEYWKAQIEKIWPELKD